MLSQLLCSVSAMIISVRYNHASDIYEADLIDPFEINSPFDFNEHIQHTTEVDMDQFNDDDHPFDHSSNTQILPNESSFLTPPMTVTSRSTKGDFQSIEPISESADTANDALNYGTRFDIESITPKQFLPNQQPNMIPIPAIQSDLLTDHDMTHTSRSRVKPVSELRERSTEMRDVLAQPDKYKWEQRRKYTHLLYHMIKNDLSFNPTVLNMNRKRFCHEMGGETLEQLARTSDHSLSQDNIVDLIGDVGSNERRRFFGKYINPDDPQIERDERRVRSDKFKQMIENNTIVLSVSRNGRSGMSLKSDMKNFFSQAIIVSNDRKSLPMRRILYRMIEKGLFFDDVLSKSDPLSLINALGESVSSIKIGGPSIPIDSIDKYIGTPDSDERNRFFGEIDTDHDRIKAIEEAKIRQSKLAMKMTDMGNQNPSKRPSLSNGTVNMKREKQTSTQIESEENDPTRHFHAMGHELNLNKVTLFPSGKQDIDILFPSLIKDEQWPQMPAMKTRKFNQELRTLKQEISHLFHSSESINDQTKDESVQKKQRTNSNDKPEKLGNSVHQSAINTDHPKQSRNLRNFRNRWESHYRQLILNPGSVKKAQKFRIINTLGKFVEIGGFAKCDLNLTLIDFRDQMNWPSLDSISKKNQGYDLDQLKSIIGDVGSDEWKYWFGYDNMTN